MIVGENDSIENILDKYVKLLSIEKKYLLFLYKDINIIENKDKLNKLKNKNCMITIIHNNNNKNKNELKNIICPKCNNLAFINMSGDNININCINNHKKENYTS